MFSFVNREPSILTALTGEIRLNTTFLEGRLGLIHKKPKLPTYWNTSFSKICLGMKIGQQLRFIVINKQADSLYSLIADGKPCRTLLSRDTWKKLIGSQASLQLDCVKDGFNAISAKKKCASKNRYRW